RVKRDVEVLESRLQRLQREARIREGPEVRRHAEAGEPDTPRQLDVLEQLRVDRRLAAGEEQHVEPARAVDDELARRVGRRHRAVRGIELLDTERALAVAGPSAPDVEHAEVLVTGTARGL